MEEKRKVVVANQYALWNYLFADIKNHNGTIEQYPYSTYGSSSDHLIYRLCNNHVTGRFLENIWFRYILKKWRVDKASNTQILFLSPSLPLVDISFLRYLQQKQIPYALLFLDTFQCMGEKWVNQIRPYLPYFSGKTYTYDEKDAIAYGWKFTRQYYSKIILPDVETDIDVFLTLFDKGRAEKAVKCYDYLTQLGVKCLFYVTGVNEAFVQKNSRPGIEFNKVLPYTDVIRHVKQSKVIIELCQQGQTSNTLRAFEAVVYGKRLITDNNSIIRFPFYDGTRMKIINNPVELFNLPIEFYKKEPLSFGYDGRFSPAQLFTKIEESD